MVAGALDPRDQVLLVVVGIWSLRLTVTLGARRFREGHEDPRYTSIRESWGPAFWWKSIFIVFALQAFLQWLIVLGPIAGLAAEPAPLGGLAWLGVVVALGGLALESIADRQLDAFKREAPAGALLTTGLRAYVRHPNYTGEIMFWCGIAAILVDGGVWLGLLSPVLIAFFLTKVSGAPLLDERLSETRPGYAAYRARVPAFLPDLTAERSRAS
jgi:steroid 5-alpha reductase family enzyme